MQTIQWMVCPNGAPALKKRCPGCGKERFISSNRFRVNANGRKIDVWLIYKCESCRHTWNLTVHSRVSPASIPSALYDGYAENDEGLAIKVACDPGFVSANRAQVLEAPFTVEGEIPSCGEETELTLRPALPVLTSVGKVLAQGLGETLSALSRMQANETLLFDGDLRKTLLTGEARVLLKPNWK